MADLDPDELDGLDLWDVFDSGSTSTDGEHNEIDIQLCIDDHSAVPCIDISSALAVENCHRDIFDSLWEVSESEPEAVGNDQDFVNGLWGSEAVGETKAPSSNSSSCDDWAADLWQVDSPMTFVRELQVSIDFREQVCFVTKGRTRKMV